MPQCYFSTLFSLISVFALSATLAYGQQVKLPQVKSSNKGYFISMPKGCSIGHYFAAGSLDGIAIFRHVVLNSALRLWHERILRFTGYGVKALSCTSNHQAALYRFQWYRNQDNLTATDSTITAVIATTGRILSVKRLGKAGVYRPSGSTIQLPSDSLFLLCEPRKGTHGFQLRCLDLQQRERWQLTIKSQKHKGHLLQCSADSAFAWLVVADNMVSRRVQHTVYCLELNDYSSGLPRRTA